MSSVINTNITSLVAQNNLSMTQAKLQTTIERLSSGLRVNSASDDASGYAIANRMDSQIRGMAVATRNANDAISFSQTTSGALSQISNNLQRMRELAVQAANGSNSASDTNLLNQEFTQLQTEVARIQASTNFNNVNVFQANDIIFQVGANTTSGDRVNMQGTPLLGTQAIATNTITDSTANTALADISSVIAAAGTASSTISSVQNAAIDAINSSQKLSFAVKTDLLNTINAAVTAESATGAVADTASAFATKLNTALTSGTATFAASGTQTKVASISVAQPSDYIASAISIAANTAGATNTTILNAAKSALAAEVAAGNISAANQTTLLGYVSGTDTATGTGGTPAVETNANYTTKLTAVLNGAAATTTFGQGTTPLSVTTVAIAQMTTAPTSPLTRAQTAVSGQTNALNAINTIDAALTEVNTASAVQGALQNRFSAVISNLTSFSQSQTAAKSRIVDADFAAETAKLSKNQILSQAGTAMLAQANQLPSGILSLLKNG
jgi:flagellin